jgi:hypothetical protein
VEIAHGAAKGYVAGRTVLLLGETSQPSAEKREEQAGSRDIKIAEVGAIGFVEVVINLQKRSMRGACVRREETAVVATGRAMSGAQDEPSEDAKLDESVNYRLRLTVGG